MQEEPPEFFVRPRNQSQQATANRLGEYDSDQPKHRYANSANIQGHSYPGFEHHSTSPFIVAPPAQNAYDTVKFGEFDEHDTSMDQDQDIAVEQIAQQQNAPDDSNSGMMLDQKSSSPAKTEIGNQQLQQSIVQQQFQQPLQQQIPQQQSYVQPYMQLQTPSIAVPGQTSSGLLPKDVSKLVDPAHPPIVKSFTISLYASSTSPVIQHHIANTLVRQHTITLSKDITRLEITPFLSISALQFHPSARITQRYMSLSDTATTQEEQQAGSATRKWVFIPAHPGSLASFEIQAAEEVYRIFVMKLAT